MPKIIGVLAETVFLFMMVAQNSEYLLSLFLGMVNMTSGKPAVPNSWGP